LPFQNHYYLSSCRKVHFHAPILHSINVIRLLETAYNLYIPPTVLFTLPLDLNWVSHGNHFAVDGCHSSRAGPRSGSGSFQGTGACTLLFALPVALFIVWHAIGSECLFPSPTGRILSLPFPWDLWIVSLVQMVFLSMLDTLCPATGSLKFNIIRPIYWKVRSGPYGILQFPPSTVSHFSNPIHISRFLTVFKKPISNHSKSPMAFARLKSISLQIVPRLPRSLSPHFAFSTS
jgi:hypothetical protein